MRYYKIGLIFIALMVLAGCATTDAKPTSSIKIEHVNWVIYNMPQKFYWNWDGDKNCAADFSIKYSGEIKPGQIESAGFKNELLANKFDIKDNINYEKKLIGYENGWFVTSAREAINGSVFPIGPTTFWFKTKDGRRYEFVLDIPEPGQSASNGTKLVFTEDYSFPDKDKLNTKELKSVACLKRPVINSMRKSKHTIQIEFTLDDDKFYSGGVSFYDKRDQVIARTKPFFSYKEKLNESFINQGAGINNQGQPNIVTVNLDELEYTDQKNAEDIVGLYLLATDGKQYANSSAGYDSISYSKRSEL